MKKYLIYVLVLSLGLSSIVSCTKKSANDPGISLKTRDARITGEWKLVSSESTTTVNASFSGVVTTTTSTSNYDGTLVTEVSNGNTDTYSYSYTMVINKGGTYTETTIDSDNDQSSDDGEWWWLNSDKKKTRIAFDDDWNSWNIDQLKNKTLVVLVSSHSIDNDANGDSYESTTTGTITFEKQ